jgi:glutaminyl-peptide cyclotransferase
MRNLLVVAALAACACGPGSRAGVPEYGYEVVHAYPQDRVAFTERLFYLDGFLYEGTSGQGSIKNGRQH